MLHRRGFLSGMASLLASPAIVRAESLMPIKVLPMNWIQAGHGAWCQETTGFVISNWDVRKHNDIWDDESLWTNPEDLLKSRRNPWMDKLKERLVAGEEPPQILARTHFNDHPDASLVRGYVGSMRSDFYHYPPVVERGLLTDSLGDGFSNSAEVERNTF